MVIGILALALPLAKVHVSMHGYGHGHGDEDHRRVILNCQIDISKQQETFAIFMFAFSIWGLRLIGRCYIL